MYANEKKCEIVLPFTRANTTKFTKTETMNDTTKIEKRKTRTIIKQNGTATQEYGKDESKATKDRCTFVNSESKIRNC